MMTEADLKLARREKVILEQEKKEAPARKA